MDSKEIAPLYLSGYSAVFWHETNPGQSQIGAELNVIEGFLRRILVKRYLWIFSEVGRARARTNVDGVGKP